MVAIVGLQTAITHSSIHSYIWWTARLPVALVFVATLAVVVVVVVVIVAVMVVVFTSVVVVVPRNLGILSM